MAARRRLSVAVAVTAMLTLAACDAGERKPREGPSGKPASGGTLTYYIGEHVPRTDPQRMNKGRDISNFGRTVYRSLVAFPASDDVGVATTAVPDLATGTGTSTNGARTWTFTLKDGITWQDGQPITCADFKYGASRVFAPDVAATAGPTYLLAYLDVPTDPKTGRPIYTGPYHSTAAGKAAFDQAITCDGNTISYHFNRPWPDFPLAVAAQHMMDPYRADQDHGKDSNLQIFSNGPYQLDGTWDEDTGGTLVRNEHYDPATDSPELRQALPDRIVFDTSRSDEEIAERLIADQGADQAAVTSSQIPSAYYRRISGEVAERTATSTTPYVEYLAPNVEQLPNRKVREALLIALDDAAWVAAGGGEEAMTEATDLVNPTVPGYQEGLFPGGAGDPEKARKLLEAAGVPMPYPVRFAYPRVVLYKERAEAVKDGWERAGFAVTLDRGGDPFTADVSLWNWGPDWPSAITVTPPVFDSRINLTEDDTGNDVGRYRSTRFEKLVDQAQQAEDIDTQILLVQQADQVLRKDVAYIPLDVPVFRFLHGSRVTGYTNTAASSSWPDLGSIGVR